MTECDVTLYLFTFCESSLTAWILLNSFLFLKLSSVFSFVYHVKHSPRISMKYELYDNVNKIFTRSISPGTTFLIFCFIREPWDSKVWTYLTWRTMLNSLKLKLFPLRILKNLKSRHSSISYFSFVLRLLCLFGLQSWRLKSVTVTYELKMIFQCPVHT